MYTIKGGGAFTRQNIEQINSNFTALTNPDIWVRPQATSSSAAADGSYERPYGSVNALSASILKPGMVVVVTLFMTPLPSFRITVA